MRLAGSFPQLRAAGRGARGSFPRPHDAGTPVYLPEPFRAIQSLPDRGRRQR